MATVYEAEHVAMHKTVALKVLRRSLTSIPEMVARFEREAVAVGRVTHPNVAGAHDFGRLSDGSFYLVLEYVPGRSLRSVLTREHVLPPKRALLIVRQIVAALVAAHRAGIVHRDLKPDNVMLVEPDLDGDLVKVLDFGIAKVISDGESARVLSQVGTLFGTPEYMAPEQVTGHAVDARADLYSVGVLLYRTLVGRTPFSGGNLTTILTRQLVEPPPPLPPDLDPRISELVMRLLEKDPGRRPQTGEAVCQYIDALLGSDARSTLPDGESGHHALSSGRETPSGARRAPVLETPPRPPPEPDLASRRLRGWTLVWIGIALSVLIPAAVWGWWALARRAPTLPAAKPAVTVTLSPAGRVVASAGAAPTERAHATASASAENPTILRRLASAGHEPSLRQLEKAEPKEASNHRALAEGYAVLGDTQTSLAHYRAALKLDASLGQHPSLLRFLRRAIDDPDYRGTVLEILALAPGEGSPDILFSVWDAARRSGKTELAKRIREQLYREPARSNASPALRIALEVWRVQSCMSYRGLLPRVIRDGDERALPVLQSLLRRTGCGRRGRGDCFACLRGGQLQRALGAAEKRPAPTF
jgi:serine/threonine-protein kinase